MSLTECPCGSKKFPWIMYDARGISCGYVCEDCESEKKLKYRSEIFVNPNYNTYEPIDEEY